MAGFLLIAAIIWMDELLDLPRLFFGAAPTPVRMGEGWMESGLTLLVGAAIVSITYRAFRRIEYLECLVVMCAWCRRVRGEEGWLTVEAFLERQHNAHTTNGICEGCGAEIRVPPGSVSPRSGIRLLIYPRPSPPGRSPHGVGEPGRGRSRPPQPPVSSEGSAIHPAWSGPAPAPISPRFR